MAPAFHLHSLPLRHSLPPPSRPPSLPSSTLLSSPHIIFPGGDLQVSNLFGKSRNNTDAT